MIGHAVGGWSEGAFKGTSTNAVIGRTTAAAVAGGVSAKLGGGKFANGAMTGAFAHLFSNEAQRKWSNPTGGKVRGDDRWGGGRFDSPRGNRPHEATDYVAEPGQNVVAVTGGKIDKIGYAYGDDLSYRYVRISTPDGYVARQLYVNPAEGIVPGAQVTAGQVIGISQALGSRYPGITEHVHVDITRNGAPVNPTTLIP
uniref:Peptidase family M23 n=1 Tax=Candidatus Kentrum sp. DK TaxID=2126562 RepID=A0A450SDF5_9GAMM|nr:MAG: Peptidase family M23 [Candidatus Kentron sp. DK]